MNWYYANEGQQVGPFTQAEFDRLISAGTVLPHTLVWHDGLESWREYGRLSAGLAGTFCSFCGREYAPDDMIRYGEQFICAQCKPVFVQRIKEGLPLPSKVDFAGFWIRLGAKLIDWFALMSAYMALFIPFSFLTIKWHSPGTLIFAMAVLYIVQFFVVLAYPTFFVGRYQATPGKMVCGLKVVLPDGGRVSYLRALGRAAAELLSQFILYIGYIMAGFDEEKRTLHDHICSTRVIRK